RSGHRCIPQHASARFRKLLSRANSEYAVHDGHLHSHVHKNSEAPRSPPAAFVRSPRYQNRSEDGHAPVRGGSGNPREGSSNPRWCRQPYAPHNLLRAWQRATLFEDDWNFASSAQRWNALSSTRWQISAALPPNFYLRDSADFYTAPSATAFTIVFGEADPPL